MVSFMNQETIPIILERDTQEFNEIGNMDL